MAVEFAVVCEIMFSARNGLEVVRVISHESAHICSGHHGRKIRILSVRLSGTSPPRVADRLHHRRPEGQSLGSGLEDRTGFVCDCGCLSFKKLRVP